LLQAAFFAPFREICGDAWRLCAETSLAVPQSLVELAEQTIDEFIVDCKDMDPDIYHAYTGGDSSVMESNLRFLIEKAGPERVVVRVPLIPDFNTKEAQQNSIKHLQELGVTRLDVFNYVRRTASEK
jgi:pyruvate formate lyase activating enzyme